MANALIVTSVASMVQQFLLPNILLLQELGYKVQVACNFENGNTCSLERVEELKQALKRYGVVFYQIDFERNVFQLSENRRAYKQIANLISKEEFTLIHCHSPIGGLLGRLAARGARKKGTRVFYTAHGFHFYKGAPLKNWLFYYPVEKLCSYFTDVLITINREDYALAKKKMKAKQVEYVPGVGVDLSTFENVSVDRSEKRKEIGVPAHAFLLLSVGELNENKNHQVIIKALAKLNDPNVHYAIAGIGDRGEYLLSLVEELGIAEQVHLLGYRKDIAELNHVADVFCFPSFREGLGLAAIEAMACGLPLITSNVHGINDYSLDGMTGYKFDPMDEDGFAQGIRSLKNGKELYREIEQYNVNLSKRYSVTEIESFMKKVYGF